MSLLEDLTGDQPSTRASRRRDLRSGHVPFAAANAVNTADVLDWLSIPHDEKHAQCPGCGEDGALICRNGGLKCLHDRCNNDGPKNYPGFRSNVDIVATVEGITPLDAATRIREHFYAASLATQFRPAKDSGSDPSYTWDLAERLKTVEPSWLNEPPPPREYLLTDTRTGKGALDAHGVAVLAAAGGVGKSFATTGLAVDVSAGTTWLGVFDAKPGRVLIVSAEEDHKEIRRRLYYVARAIGVTSLLERIDVLDLHDQHAPLLDEQGPTRFAVALEEFVRERGPYALVIIDPLGRVAGVRIDVDNTAAAELIGVLERISSAAGGLVLAVHHTDKVARRNKISDATAVRGATGLGDYARAVLMLSAGPVGEPGLSALLGEVVTLTRAKGNHIAYWAPVELRRGEFGELLPLDGLDRERVNAARQDNTPAKKQRDREAERALKLAERARRAAELRAECEAQKVAERRQRDEEDDASARQFATEHPDATVRDLMALVMKARSCGSDRAHAAVSRVRRES